MREHVYFDEHNEHDEDRSLEGKDDKPKNSKTLMMTLRPIQAPMTNTRILKTASAMPWDFMTVAFTLRVLKMKVLKMLSTKSWSLIMTGRRLGN